MVDASISLGGGNQYEEEAFPRRRQAALKKRLSLRHRVYLKEDALLTGRGFTGEKTVKRGFFEGIAS